MSSDSWVQAIQRPADPFDHRRQRQFSGTAIAQGVGVVPPTDCRASARLRPARAGPAHASLMRASVRRMWSRIVLGGGRDDAEFVQCWTGGRCRVLNRDAPAPSAAPLDFFPTHHGQANPFLPGRSGPAAAPGHPLAVFEQGNLPARADFQRLRRLRQAALRGLEQQRAVRGRAQPGSEGRLRQGGPARSPSPTTASACRSRRRSTTWAPSPRAARASS